MYANSPRSWILSFAEKDRCDFVEFACEFKCSRFIDHRKEALPLEGSDREYYLDLVIRGPQLVA